MIRYYTDFTDDFVATKNQTKQVPDNYRWIKTNPFYRALGFLIFQILKLVGLFYAKFFLHLKIEGKDKIKAHLREQKHSAKSAQSSTAADAAKSATGTAPRPVSGYYIFANHTLELGDVFNPALYSPRHPYYVCNSSNLGIPVLGPVLPLVGALPIPDSIRGKKQLFDAIKTRIKQGNAIIIYPEAHLWPYYTKIRPFENTAFNFPVRDGAPVFTATTVFTAPQHPKRHPRRRPKQRPHVTIYIDGPFYPDTSLDKHARIQQLHDQVETQLKARASLSNYSYIEYCKKP